MSKKRTPDNIVNSLPDGMRYREFSEVFIIMADFDDDSVMTEFDCINMSDTPSTVTDRYLIFLELVIKGMKDSLHSIDKEEWEGFKYCADLLKAVANELFGSDNASWDGISTDKAN